ncbi:hypothetical protein IQ07DRAFT_614726 [Pyrenochaeta sp. DS3sAY3a]|nr:hypothetical protein IQ07DRAFT_614726 [Pyrenochaeta sp. DS3sAY3a]
MCRVEERIYIGADGHRSKFEESFPCDKSRGGRLCSKVKRRTSEYYPKNGTKVRDDTPSPINPPTPTGTGTYITQERRPSATVVRPSTRDGKREIVIEFGGKKGKSSKYPSVSVSTGTYKRSSMGGSSIGSNDVAIESPGSDASNTIRTGFPDAPLPPSAIYGSSVATPTVAHGHHRQTSSTSSFTGSSRTPSLYITSDPDYDSPVTYRTGRNNGPPIVHNPTVGAAPSSPSRNQPGLSSGYRTTVVAPHGLAPGFSQETHTPDGLFPLDYAEFADRSASSHASSGAPENTRRPKSSDERRKKKEADDLRKLQEEVDRKFAEELAKEENVKQKERERLDREERDEARRQTLKDLERREREEQGKAKKEKSKPPTNDFTRQPTRGRRNSMTQAQVDEQRRLIAAETAHMQGERDIADARDREERLATARLQQEAPGYWDPRGGDRNLASNSSNSTVTTSLARRNSVTSSAAPGLARSNSKRRTSIIQPNPPVAIAPQTYSSRPSARREGPPVSFPSNFNQEYIRPTSARRNSVSLDNPFAAPPTRGPAPLPLGSVPPRGSGSSVDNPFAPTSALSPTAPADPWDLRTVQDALPPTRDAESRYNLKQRGEAVISRATPHSRAQQATRAMGRAAGFEDDYEDDSDEVAAPAYVPRSAMSGKGKKKH